MSDARAFAVVGAGGFIGSRIVEILHLDRRIEVRPIARRASALVSAARFGIRGYVADALDERALAAALDGCEVVVHAIAGDPRTIEQSVAPVYHAAEAARCRRVVYLSSAMVHGQAPPAGVDEKSALSERQEVAYNNAKVRAEATLFRLRESGRTEAVALRPGIVYGPRSRWIGDFADAVLTAKAFLVGGGGGLCNAVYVDNVVHAIELAATVTAADGEAFLIGEEEALSWRDFYAPIATALGHSMSEVASVSFEHKVASFKERIDDLRMSETVQGVLEALPHALRHRLGALWKASGALPESRAPAPTLELALLHQSRYAPAWTTAARVLGYAPVVSRAEAFRRTVGWLAFAGYPVVDAEKGGAGAHG